MRGWFLAVALGLPLMFAAAAGDEPKPPNPPTDTGGAPQTLGEQLKLLQKEVSDAYEDWREASRASQELLSKLADTEVNKTQRFNAVDAALKKLQRYQRKLAENAAKAVELARRNPKSESADEALNWAVPGLQRGSPEQIKEVVALVQERHLESPKIRLLVDCVGRVGLLDLPDPVAIDFLTAVAEKNPDRATRATALMGQVARYKAKAEPYGRPAAKGATEWRKKAEQTLERVAREFGEVKFYHDTTFGDKAKRELFELRNLAIGKVAPEIEGEDLDGARFKLSDYRGRVVVLSFWAHW